MRGLVIVVGCALLGVTGCASNGGAGSSGSPAAPITAEQAREIMQAAGYSDISPVYRSRDDGSWEATATIDGVPYIVDVDSTGLLVSR
jgi:hypothetical protein